MSGARAAFLDRDGVINELVPDPETGLPESPLKADDVALISGAAAALRQLAAAGWLLVGVSNQPAGAKGTASIEELEAVQACVARQLEAEGIHFDDFRFCFHHPLGVVPELSRECDCRKPAPGMLLDAADHLGIDLGSSWMIGDTDNDILAGKGAGCHTILIEHAHSAHKRDPGVHADRAAPSLDAAVAALVREE